VRPPGPDRERLRELPRTESFHPLYRRHEIFEEPTPEERGTMTTMRCKLVARLMLAALVLTLAPAGADAGGARLEGYLLDLDGRAARGYTVHLIDVGGVEFARSSTSDRGVYRFRELPAGEYALGVGNPEGQVAPVAAPPVRVAGDELARRDIKLVEAGDPERQAVGVENRSFGVFWAGLSPSAKAWTVVGTVVILGITVQALDDEDDGSPVQND
jgi:hypothetical protein